MFNKENFLKNAFLLNILFLLYNSIVKIPLNFYPIDKINFSDPSGIMEYYVDQLAYANFEIGSERQKVQIPLKFDTNDFYLVDNSSFAYDPKKFSGYKMYDSSISESHEIIDEDLTYGDAFEIGTYHRDDFYFNNKKYPLEFYLTLSYSYSDSGGIGMQLYPSNDIPDSSRDIKMTFLEKLKVAKLSTKNIWTIFYNTKNNILEDEGFILIGAFPDELNSDLGYYKKEYFYNVIKNVNMPLSQNQFIFGFEIDSIIGYKGNTNQIIEDFPYGTISFKNIQLNYNSGGIYLPKNIQKFYTTIFEEYINSTCFQGKFNGFTNYFYYCKNDKKVINKIKESFPRIILKSNDFAFNFTLEADDVFVEHNDYVICLIYFTTTSDNVFKFGKPFLKKYLFTFNYDSKNVYFYLPGESGKENDKQNGKKKDNKVSIVILIIAIIATVIVVSVICYLIFKFFLYERFFRKKRANELEDADYEYTTQEGKDGLNINFE